MPIMDGWECAKTLRLLMKEKQLPSIPIIALTAYVSLKAVTDCLRSGMDYVIHKPINHTWLKRELERFIQVYEEHPND